MRSYSSIDEMSEEGSRAIRAVSILEAKMLIKELLVSSVQQHIETDKQRIRVKEMEAELKNKDAILKAFLSKGASVSDYLVEDGRAAGNTPDEAEAHPPHSSIGIS